MRKKQKRDDGFPRKLLKSPVTERIMYFKRYTVAHPTLVSCFDSIMPVIQFPAGSQLIFLIGPSRVGKTFLKDWIVSTLKRQWQEYRSTNPEADPGRIIIPWLEIPAKTSLKDIFIRALVSANEPCIEAKLPYPPEGERSINWPLGARGTLDGLRRSFENVLIYRNPAAYIFDEAQHFLSTPSLTPQQLMDLIKSIANMTNTLFILMGTYELTPLLDLSDQLMKRTLPFHFKRYGASGEDQATFKRVIYSFQKNMPLLDEPDLLSYSDYLYDRTAGCVGLLSLWFLRTFVRMHQSGSPRTMSIKDLQKDVRFSAERSRRIRETYTQDEDDLESLMGTDESPIKDEVEGTDILPAKQTRRARPGRRKPNRDSIGPKK